MSYFFSFDPFGDGLTFHDTAEEAKQKAEESLDYCRDVAGSDGWSDEVEWICWGRVSQCIKLISSEPDPSGRFDSIDNYDFVSPVPFGLKDQLLDETDNAALQEVHAKGCECGDDEACQFVRERDALRTRIVELERELAEAQSSDAESLAMYRRARKRAEIAESHIKDNKPLDATTAERYVGNSDEG